MIAAASGTPLYTGYGRNERSTPFESLLPATPEQEMAYRQAASYYHGGRWADAVRSFDAVASSPSPYAAAAAYSAARAALDDGAFPQGIQRVAAILADPGKQQAHQAAHHLIGTLASITDASPLLAARLLEISHLLMAPQRLRCGDFALRSLAFEASDDLQFLLRFAYPTNRWDNGPTWSPHRHAVFTAVAKLDPVIDLARTLAAPSSFVGERAWTEPFYPQAVPMPGFPIGDQPDVASANTDAAALTAHAREMVLTTGSPLWAYTLASRTTEMTDLPTIQAARLALESMSLDGAEATLDKWIAAQEARMLLMAGREDEAFALGHDALAKRGGSSFGFGDVRSFLSGGGMRYLLAHRDLEGARRWAGLAYPDSLYAGGPLSTFIPALANSWAEVLKAGTSQPGKASEALPDASASALDLLSADRLAALARTPGLSAAWRRPLLSSAWVRHYMLGHSAAFYALFPDVRAAFPEIATDLDAIDRAWLASTRRHLVTRLLLRLPGLSPRVLWARGPPGGFEPVNRPNDLFSINSSDPNDGNWWCPIDPARARRDAFAQDFASQLSRDFWPSASSFASLWPSGSLPAGSESVDELASSWLSWHPLFKDSDPGELDRLSKVASGPARLSAEAVAWARESSWLTRWLGWDRDLPETLALAVRATRYACRRADPLGPSSREAWQALHHLYSQTEWAQRTPYWFQEN